MQWVFGGRRCINWMATLHARWRASHVSAAHARLCVWGGLFACACAVAGMACERRVRWGGGGVVHMHGPSLADAGPGSMQCMHWASHASECCRVGRVHMCTVFARGPLAPAQEFTTMPIQEGCHQSCCTCHQACLTCPQGMPHTPSEMPSVSPCTCPLPPTCSRRQHLDQHLPPGRPALPLCLPGADAGGAACARAV